MNTSATDIETPESSELNTDSTIGLLRIMALFSNPNMQQGTEDDSDSYFAINQFRPLMPSEINTVFRSSFLARKIIEKYPIEARGFGYQVETETGEVITKNDPLVLEAMYEASIYSRLYGHCYLILNYKNSLPMQPIIPGEILASYQIEFELTKEGDYFRKSDQEYYHYTKIQLFHGRKSYVPYLTPYDPGYADSVLQSIIISMRNFISSNATCRKILSNISYLLLGIKNLGNMTKTDKGRDDVYMRLESIRTNRNVNRVLTYDKENEALPYISQSVTGIVDIIGTIKEIFIAESDYPASQLFEEADRQSIGSGIANQLIARFLWAKRCRGFAVDNFQPHYETYYNRHYPDQNYLIKIPFRMELTLIEKAELEKFASERTKNLIDSGVISPEEARSGYRNDEFDLNIILDDELFKEYVLSKSQQVVDEKFITPDNGNGKTTTLEGDRNLDSVFNPSDAVWDQLANITESDLIAAMKAAIGQSDTDFT